ncbi:MAG: radical SAM protein [Bryobacteraceae bacterium]
MRIHLVNPSDVAFGVGVITPRWLYVLAAATPAQFGTPVIVDETLEPIDPDRIQPGDVVGIGIHTANALRGFEVGRMARERGAFVVFGGIHSTLYPNEAQELGAAHAVVKGDGDVVWSTVLDDCVKGDPKALYDGGRVNAGKFLPARWDLLPKDKYMWASVQTVRGCPKHCSFCSVWRTDGQKPRQRSSDAVIEEIVQLRRLGYRFIALADDNFYPVTLKDIQLAERQDNAERVAELKGLRAERFEFMERLAELPKDTILFTQITMEAAEDTAFLEAMRKAHIKGALVGVEAVTPEGLKSVYKDFNLAGDNLVERLRLFRSHGVHILGSFIFGLSTDRADTFQATADLAKKADLTFAQFVMMTPFPGTVDFDRWEKAAGDTIEQVDGIPLTRYWLIPGHRRPKLYMPHPSMSADEIRARTQGVWDNYYSLGEIWKRAKCVKSIKARLAFVFVSKLYRQMYANTGIATDSARRKTANRWARWTGLICLRLFRAQPMPDLQVPGRPAPLLTTISQ